MNIHLGRRRLLELAASFFAYSVTRSLAGASNLSDKFIYQNGVSNFQNIYADPALKKQFLDFLTNVYRLYPEQKFHDLISRAVQSHRGDQAIYNFVFANLTSIKPVAGELTYALPALAKQKRELAEQTVKLLKNKKSVNGYVEIGTPGRYVKRISERLKLKGKTYIVHDQKPDFGLTDIVERGKLKPYGNFIPLDDYAPWPKDKIADNSVELVSNFIGFHHSPRESLDGFVQSIRRVLRPGGQLVLRDHDAHSPQMFAMVALAHDVFNAGLGVPWEINAKELRFFLSKADTEKYLLSQGFEVQGPAIYQEGDPTLNALMLFTKKV